MRPSWSWNVESILKICNNRKLKKDFRQIHKMIEEALAKAIAEKHSTYIQR